MKRRRGRRGFWWWSWLLALITIGATVGGFYYGKKRWEAAPKDYVAEAVIKVNIREPFEASSAEAVGTDIPNSNEEEVLRQIESIDGLTPIIVELGLADRWGMSAEEAVSELKISVDLDLNRSEKELDVKVTRHDAEESAELANAIARAIPTTIKAQDDRNVTEGEKRLKEELQAHIEETETARLALKKAFEANQLPIDPQPGLDVGPYSSIPAVVAANLDWVAALELYEGVVDGQRKYASYLRRDIPASVVKSPAVPPTRISGPLLEPFQVQTALYGLTLGLVVGSLLSFVCWKLFP